MSSQSPTSRTLAVCKKRGWTAGIVERRLTRSIKQDLFGCIDIVAITPDGMLGIQATSGANHAARMTKALAEPRLAVWLSAGARFAVWSWSKKGDRGKRKLWTLREEPVLARAQVIEAAQVGAIPVDVARKLLERSV